MTVAAAQRTLPERALEVLRRAGNPFRNYFARNPDDEVCARYHVAELFATERDQILGVVDLYRYDPHTHSEVVPVLGNKGSGKTHLLHTIKHGGEGAWQVLVTPGVYQKDSDFLEYLLFQLIDTVLGGGKQKGTRPLEFVGEELVRRLFLEALSAAPAEQRLNLFPAPGLGRWTRKLGLGTAQAQERTQYLLDQLGQNSSMAMVGALRRACTDVSLESDRACTFVCEHIERTAAHNTAGLMQQHIYQGFVRSVLLGDDSDLANFLTFGFAELEFRVHPSRQELVLALFKSLMEVFLGLKIPVVVAFDQLEDLLLARRTDDGHRVAEAFFAGIVQAMHQIDGLCFLIFAERGLWNRFVPSLDGYIQDRLNNPVHVPRHGTIKALRLEAPPPGLVRRVVEARLRPALEELPDFTDLPAIYPFNDEQVERIARTEPTLRDMLQQYRHLFDHMVYGTSPQSAVEREITATPRIELPPESEKGAVVKSVVVVETSSAPKPTTNPTPLPETAKASAPMASATSAPKPRARSTVSTVSRETWDQEMAAACAKIESEGALTGATRELQAGLGAFLQACYEHGVKVGPWRLRHVVPEWTFGDHPTYGAISIGHWVCKEGQPWKVGVGLFLGRGNAKSKDLGIKLAAFEAEPPVIDHLILLRPEDDMALTAKSKTLWQESEKKSHHARLEAVPLSSFAVLYGFPRWHSALQEATPAGQDLPNFADLLQERCEKLLEQVCMPIQG
jgi:hypothetical protein